MALGDSHKLSVVIWGTGRSVLLGERFRDNNAYPDAGQVDSGVITGVGVWLCSLVKPQESEGRVSELPVGEATRPGG